jgi:hypothetical protein
MAAELILRWADDKASAVGNLGLRFVNTSGTPIISCARRDLTESGYDYEGGFNGALIADTYSLTFNADGTLCYVAAGEGVKNPYHTPAGIAIVDDGSTPHDAVLPGLRLVFFNGITVTNTAIVTIGAYTTAAGATTRAINFGPVKNDAEVASIKATVINIGVDQAVKCSIRPTPALYYTGTNAMTHIARLGPHSSSGRDQLAPASGLSMTFDTWTNAGPYYTANVKIGGALAIATAKFDGETIYEYGGGIGYVDAADRLKGLQVVFALTAVDPTANAIAIIVRDGWTWARLSLDVSGSPGEMQNAAVALPDLAAGESVDVWLGVAVPLGQARGAIRMWTPKIVYEEV